MEFCISSSLHFFFKFSFCRCFALISFFLLLFDKSMQSNLSTLCVYAAKQTVHSAIKIGFTSFTSLVKICMCVCCFYTWFIKFILNSTASELYTFMAFKRDMFYWLACYCRWWSLISLKCVVHIRFFLFISFSSAHFFLLLCWCCCIACEWWLLLPPSSFVHCVHLPEVFIIVNHLRAFLPYRDFIQTFTFSLFECKMFIVKIIDTENYLFPFHSSPCEYFFSWHI